MESNIDFQDLPKKMKPFVKTLLDQSNEFIKSDKVEITLVLDEVNEKYFVNIESDEMGFAFNLQGVFLFAFNWQQ